MSVVELDRGDAEKILDDLREARAVVGDMAEGIPPTNCRRAADLAWRIQQSEKALRVAGVE